ncbi:hypothetical protein, conserved [Trypanosoma brucei gambiense DAL972]|uniref:Etoposide-induced protein 2.4 (EI24) n=1 Tax=Trypanosoma brucei gambiense (strain MHOM/CI/86/DAL972) TaxID=679716 RepID=C9ZL63_TRYB9|nr:hypothetical protein, conserved [Trypanosoma brucei gambiense DAL972]CBH10072.1 hypothetical protein, conserved [Trypanosoma brucei gambiense DAL972]|eukprot:XP_011772362.1 hypothetical protein, conserved [Trypanosoma brucei gambiense DAL972]
MSSGVPVSSQWPPVRGGLIILRAAFSGARQSLDVVKFLSYVGSSAEVSRNLRSCTLVNFLFFFGIWISSIVFSPLWSLAVTLMRGRLTLAGDPDAITNSASLSNVNRVVGGATGVVTILWTCVFYFVWVFPMYGITLLFGIRWYNALYAAANSEKRRRALLMAAARSPGRPVVPVRGAAAGAGPKPTASSLSFSDVVVSLTETLFKVVATSLCTVVMTVVGAILPVPLGACVDVAMRSWLHAFYVFDYRVSSQYVTDRVTQRRNYVGLSSAIEFFEANWAYFLGFGASRCLVTGVLDLTGIVTSWFAKEAAVSVLFGAHVVLSVEAKLPPRAPFSIPMFTPFFILCDKIIRAVVHVAQ